MYVIEELFSQLMFLFKLPEAAPSFCDAHLTANTAARNAEASIEQSDEQ